MNQQNWEKLTFFEQLSNIGGEVKRLADNHQAFLQGKSKDYSAFYLEKIKSLIRAAFPDPENDKRREKELLDEADEISEYLKGRYSAAYILSYWDQYTKAVSASFAAS